MSDTNEKNIIQKLRGPRLAGFVIFDTIASVLGALLISYMFNTNTNLTILVLFLLSIILHMTFNINTHTNYILGLSEKPKIE